METDKKALLKAETGHFYYYDSRFNILNVWNDCSIFRFLRSSIETDCDLSEQKWKCFSLTINSSKYSKVSIASSYLSLSISNCKVLKKLIIKQAKLQHALHKGKRSSY